MSVKSQANHKVHKLKEENENLLHRISELQEHKTAMVSVLPAKHVHSFTVYHSAQACLHSKPCNTVGKMLC